MELSAINEFQRCPALRCNLHVFCISSQQVWYSHSRLFIYTSYENLEVFGNFNSSLFGQVKKFFLGHACFFFSILGVPNNLPFSFYSSVGIFSSLVGLESGSSPPDSEQQSSPATKLKKKKQAFVVKQIKSNRNMAMKALNITECARNILQQTSECHIVSFDQLMLSPSETNQEEKS